MRIEPIPIQQFVEHVYAGQQVSKLVAEWRIEPEDVIRILVGSFKSMGIFFVHPTQQTMCADAVIHHLLYAPEIISLVEKARRDSEVEKLRAARHGDL